ncbi:MAG: hypothetical protein ACTHK2_17165 [Dokdonella sp.]
MTCRADAGFDRRRRAFDLLRGALDAAEADLVTRLRSDPILADAFE